MCQNAEKDILSIFKHFYGNAKSISLLHFIFESFPYSSKWSLKPFSIVLVTLYYFSPTEIQIKSQMTRQLPFHWARLGWQLARKTCPDTGWELLLVLSCVPCSPCHRRISWSCSLVMLYSRLSVTLIFNIYGKNTQYLHVHYSPSILHLVSQPHGKRLLKSFSLFTRLLACYAWCRLPVTELWQLLG